MNNDRLMDIQIELDRIKNVAVNAVTKQDLAEVVKSINILSKRLEDNRKLLDNLGVRMVVLITAILGSNIAINEGAGIRNIVRFFAP